MQWYAAILLFAFSSTITPGPNNVMLLASGLNHGVRRSLPHLFGICLGFPAMVALVGFGLGVVFARFPLLHEAIKVAGVLYLLYLAWLIATAAPGSLDSRASHPIGFWQAALFQWVNPKAWAMATSAIAAYTAAGADIHLQVLLIALAFFAAALPCCGIWLCFGVGLKRYLQQPHHRRWFNRVMAALLVLSILPVVWDLAGRVVT